MKKQTDLTSNKSVLAKLMAAENITVHHRQIRTAKFDLKNRVLHCPVWKDMDTNIYDLLMGHEISHALHTPADGWHDAIVYDTKRKNIKRFLNVVEDARIEKIVKRKYPGLRKPFAEAYQALADRDLFGVKKIKDLSKLGLIDRINLYFKIGASVLVEFSPAEKKFVDRVATVETWDEVAELAREIYDFQKYQAKDEQKKQEKKEEKDDAGDEEEAGESGDEGEGDEEGETEAGSTDPDDGEDESDGDDADGEGSGDGDEGDEESDGDADGESDGDADGEGEVEDGPSAPGAGLSKEERDSTPEPDSITDAAQRKMEDDLINSSAPQIIYADLPKVDLKRCIVPHKVVLERFETEFGRACSAEGYNFGTLCAQLHTAFLRRNKNYIDMLVKEFEMRKNANQYARQLTAKTGELDDKKLNRYKFTNDIFRKITTVTKGKSHGMILFLDLSGSMDPIIKEIVEQMLILTTFCKRVNIPFDVYGFGDQHSYNYSTGGSLIQANRTNGVMLAERSYCSGFNLRHMFSSNLRGSNYQRAMNMLHALAQIGNSSNRDQTVKDILTKNPNWAVNIATMGYQTGGTPYMHMLLASRQIIEEFKNNHKVDITSVIHLTDGDGDGFISFGDEQGRMSHSERQKTIFGLIDPKTKLSQLPDNTISPFVPYQVALTKLVGQITGCRHIGYFFGDSAIITMKIGRNPTLAPKARELTKRLQENGWVSTPDLGYDSYYYIDTAKMTYKAELRVSVGMSQEAAQSSFNHHMNQKKNVKTIVREFAAEVAEGL
jgi:hypothetical protein